MNDCSPQVLGGARQWACLGGSVQGAAHKRADKENQDALLYDPISGSATCAIMAIADGHGSAKCPHSKLGARFAVDVAVEALRQFASEWNEQKATWPAAAFHREAEVRIPLTIVRAWRERVDEDWRRRTGESTVDEAEPSDSSTVRLDAGEAEHYIRYGSTLLAVMVMPELMVCLQLGDGEIILVSDDGLASRLWPPDPRFIANETSSLSAGNAPHEFREGIVRAIVNSAPSLILLCTDGYSNSFKSDADFLKVGPDLLEAFRAGEAADVRDSLETWLTKTSAAGSGDDVSLGMIYRTDLAPVTKPRENREQAGVATPAVLDPHHE